MTNVVAAPYYVSMSPKYTYWANNHSGFVLPAATTIIWRYMTLARFLELVRSRRLFFCRASKLEDRFEGSIPRVVNATLETWSAQYPFMDASDQMRNERIKNRDMFAINCWHVSDYESLAMWNQYGGTEGVAIRSSVERLTRALTRRLQRDDHLWHEIYVGRVNYIDYAVDEFPRGDPLAPFIYKRKCYEHEKELRAVTPISHSAELAKFSRWPTEFELNDIGIAIPVELSTLIEAIHVSPTAQGWFEGLVKESVERFGFDSAPVVKSSLVEEPNY